MAKRETPTETTELCNERISDTWPDGPKPSTHVIRTVGRHLGRDPLSLPPLYDTVDPDLLDALVTQWTTSDRAGTLRFTYVGLEVVCSPDGLDLTTSFRPTR